MPLRPSAIRMPWRGLFKLGLVVLLIVSANLAAGWVTGLVNFELLPSNEEMVHRMIMTSAVDGREACAFASSLSFSVFCFFAGWGALLDIHHLVIHIIRECWSMRFLSSSSLRRLDPLDAELQYVLRLVCLALSDPKVGEHG